MDYEFRRDLCGRYQALFSMGHEVLGFWLTEELAKNDALIDTLLDKVEALQERQCWEFLQSGREFTLKMTPEGVEIAAALLDDLNDTAPEELNHYDQESYAHCGLDDFYNLLMAWAEFIGSPRVR